MSPLNIMCIYLDLSYRSDEERKKAEHIEYLCFYNEMKVCISHRGETHCINMLQLQNKCFKGFSLKIDGKDKHDLMVMVYV